MLLFFIDSSGELTIDDFIANDYSFQKSEHDVPNLKNTKSAIWMKFTVKTEVEAEWMFEYAAPYIDTVDFFIVYTDNSYGLSQTGTRFTFSHREVNVPNFVFKLSSEASEYYMRIRTDFNTQFPVKIMTKDKLLEKNNNTDLIQGFYFGIIILIILYNFFIWLSSREKIYILYVFYALAIGLMIFMNKGYAFKFHKVVNENLFII